MKWINVLSLCLVIIVATGGERPPMPDPGEGYFLLNEGNSLMGQLHGWTRIQDKKVTVLGGLAHVLGFPKHDAEGVGAAGIPIDWAWQTPHKRQEFFDDLAAHDVSLFTVQAFGWGNRRDVEVEAYAAAQMYRHVLQKNPDCPLLVYETWPSGRNPGGAHRKDIEGELKDNGGDAEAYMQGLQACYRDYMDRIAHVLRQEFPDKPVYLIPCPQAMHEVGRRIKANGQCGGMTHIAELLDTGGRSVHTSRKGVFLTCMVHLASYYCRNPAAAEMPVDYETVFAFNLKEGQKPTGLTPEQGKELAQLAWEVVSSYPATPVSRKEFAFDDMEKPAPAVLAKKEVLSAKQAAITWTPGSDNNEVRLQAIYLDGELVGRLDAKADHFIVGDLKSGHKNQIVVRTFDMDYNFSDLKIELNAPNVQGSAVILGWDLAPYTLNSNDREPAKYKLIEEVTVTQAAGADVLAGTLKYGPGTGRGGRPFRHCMLISKAGSKTLQEAVAAETYVTFTVQPVDGKTLSLKSLILPIAGSSDAMELALMSSIGGFSADNAIETMTVAPGYADMEFPLHRHPELQNLDKAVEFRIYFIKGGGQTYIGNYSDPDEAIDMILRGEVK